MSNTTKLTLTMFPTRCKVAGCGNDSGMYGVCSEHEAEQIGRHFDAAVRDGLVRRDPPACFAGDMEWKEYVVAASLVRNANERSRNPIEYCKDCTPSFRAEMSKAGRCSHEETVFVRSDRHGGDLIGVCLHPMKRSTQAWESAVMGMSGEVVDLPGQEQIRQAIERIQEAGAPKKRGPRFKKDRLSA